MAFIQDPTGYHKTVLSDLQASWSLLRVAVVNNFGFTDSDKLLFHIDEAMSWESVRDLGSMKATFIVIQNIAIQSNAPETVMKPLNAVRDDLDETFLALAEGKGL